MRREVGGRCRLQVEDDGRGPRSDQVRLLLRRSDDPDGRVTPVRERVVTGPTTYFGLGATLTVPSMSMTGGRFSNLGKVVVAPHGRLTLDHTAAFLGGVDGVVGTLGAEIQRYPAVVRSLSLDAATVVDRCTTPRSCPTISVTGDAKLAGTLEFVVTSRARIGDRFVVMRVGGVLIGTFDQVTGATTGVAVSYEPEVIGGVSRTVVVVTVTG